HGRDDGRPAEKGLQADGAVFLTATRRAVGAGEEDRVTVLPRAAAQEIKRWLEVWLDRIEPIRIDAAVSEQGVDEMIGRIGNEHKILVEQCLQPQPDAILHPIAIEMHADVADPGLRRGDTLNLAQHAFGMMVEGAREQLS